MQKIKIKIKKYLDKDLMCFIITYFKRVKSPNNKFKTLKFLEYNIGGNLADLKYGEDFLDHQGWIHER